MIDIEIDENFFPGDLCVSMGDDCDYLNRDEAMDFVVRLMESIAVLDRVEATRDRFTNYNPQRHRSPRWGYGSLDYLLKKYRTSVTEALQQPSRVWGTS